MSICETAEDGRRRLTSLFDENFDDLHRFCVARSGSAVVAEDVVAETFTAAARAITGNAADRIDRAWLFVVAKRRLIDQWRASGREQRRVERLASLRTTDSSSAGAADDADVAERVLAALGSLPPRQRAALSLRYLDEMSVAEVADALGIAYAAAESLLARGRRGFSLAWKERS